MQKRLPCNLLVNKKILTSLVIALYILLGYSTSFSKNGEYGLKPVPASIKNMGILVLQVDKNGRLFDRQIHPEELSRYSLSKSNNNTNYTIVTSLNQPESIHGLKILLRASAQLMAHPDALLAFRRAAARWERVINDQITIVIDADYGSKRSDGSTWPANVIGSTDAALNYVTIQNKYAGVADMVSLLKQKHPGDSQLQSLYNAIPVPTLSTSGSNLDTAIVGQVTLQSLGLDSTDINPDPHVHPYGTVPNISFNSGFSFDLDPSDGISPGLIDFDGVVVHEMGHALGFFSLVSGDHLTDYFTPLDLFRVRPESVTEGNLTGFNTAVRVITPGPPPSQVLAKEGGKTYYKANQVFFDGLKIREFSTGDGNAQGGDGSQASHWRHSELRLPSLGNERFIGIMDPSVGPGERDTMRANDIRAFEIIGYNVNYSSKFASAAIKFGNQTLDLDKSSDTIKLGNVNINSSVNVSIQLINTNLDNALDYSINVIPAFQIPSSASGTLTLGSPEGTVAASQNANVNLTLNGGQAPAVYYGTLEFRTNDANRLVIDIPYRFSAGNAAAPSASLTPSHINDFRFEKNTPADTISKEITITNNGTLDLEYKLITSLSSDSSNPVVPPSLLKSAGNNTIKRNLYRFYSPGLVTDKLIFSSDFENGFGGFTTRGIRAVDRQIITKDKSANDGHSKPSAAYLGLDYGDSLRTRLNTNAMLISPAIDLSSISTKDIVTLSFNYYLDAEAGYNFASVLVSTDGGSTFSTIATSNGGILHNTTAWQPVLIQLPYLSGNPGSVKFAFKFTSDTLVNKKGWYIDDIQVNSVQNSSSLYTSILSGVVPGPGSSSFTLTANKSNLQLGHYLGTLTVQSNDPLNGNMNFLFNVSNLQANPGVVNKLYAVSYRNGGKLLQINPSNGSAAEIGAAGMEGVKSLTINPMTLQLFALNVKSGINNIILMDGNSGTGVFYSAPDIVLDAIAFDGSGTLYGTGSDQNLYKVNLQTGKTELVKKLGFKAAAITFNTSTGDLWLSVDAPSDKDRLYRLNISGGDTILVGRTGLGKITRGLVFDKNNNLFGVTGDLLQASNFISINTQNASASLIGPVGQSAVYGLTMKVDTTATSIDTHNDNVPSKFELSQNYPNPFNPATTINYSLPGNSHVTLKVFNILGQEIATLVDKEQTAGNYSVRFNAENLSTGIYLYELRAGNYVSVRKMILAK